MLFDAKTVSCNVTFQIQVYFKILLEMFLKVLKMEE